MLRKIASRFSSLGSLLLLCSALAMPVAAQVFPDPPSPKPKIEPKKKPAKKSAREKRRSEVAVVVAPAPPPFVGAVPREMTGLWSLRETSGLFSTPYTVWVKIDGGDLGGPIGRVDYYTEGTSSISGSYVCGGPLWLETFDGTNIVVTEKIERKGIFCPGGDMMRASTGDQGLWIEFFKPPKKQGKKEKSRVKSWAIRAQQAK
jgi:hypothetical protein